MSLPERIAKIQNHAERVEEEIEVLRKRLRKAEVTSRRYGGSSLRRSSSSTTVAVPCAVRGNPMNRSRIFVKVGNSDHVPMDSNRTASRLRRGVGTRGRIRPQTRFRTWFWYRSEWLPLELETAETPIESPSTPHGSEHDPAFGEMTTPFTQGTEEVGGRMGSSPSLRRANSGLHWSLMVAMITMWSALGAVIGFLAPAWIGVPSLLGMAILGLMLGERWIPDPSMRVLGVVWVIVSMKMLYGLMIDLGHWGLLGPQPDMIVGALLIGTVVLNLIIAHHHDEDAIAAQATLILLLIGSRGKVPRSEVSALPP